MVGLDLPDGLSAFYVLALRLKYRDKSDAILEKALPMSHALPFLTDSEVREIVSPLKQPAAIVRWFAIRGFVMKVKPNGLPLIGRHHFEEVMSGGKSPTDEKRPSDGPDVKSLLDRFSKGRAQYGHGKKTEEQPARTA